MAGLREGRKSIIFVSEGFTALLPTQLQRSGRVAARRRQSVSRRSRRAAGDRDSPATVRQGRPDLATCSRCSTRSTGRTRRSTPSIRAASPPSSTTSTKGVGIQQDAVGLRASLDTLHELAENTDGRAIVNRNDLAVGMKQIMRDSSGYYLLGYNSTQAPTDGKFHYDQGEREEEGCRRPCAQGLLGVHRSRTSRAPARRRRGPRRHPRSRRRSTDLAAPARDRAARFWIGTARGENGKTRLTFLWEPAPSVAGQRAEEPAARVALTAIAPDGRPVFSGRVPEQAATAVTSTPARALRSRARRAALQPRARRRERLGHVAGGAATFDVQPGQLELKMVVEGSRGQVIDSVGRELTVPDYSTVQVSFGTPRVYRVRSIPELQALKAKPDAPPTADRRVQPRPNGCTFASTPTRRAASVPTVTARLLNRAGQVDGGCAGPDAAGPFGGDRSSAVGARRRRIHRRGRPARRRQAPRRNSSRSESR